MFSFDRLTIPLIQAPMAGGSNSPEMITAVVNAGGVGSYGFAYSTPDKITTDLTAARELVKSGSKGAINANFFVFDDVDTPDQSIVEAAIESLLAVSSFDDVSFQIPKRPYFPDLNAQLEPVWAFRPEVVTFHSGLPSAEIIERAHSLDIAIGITTTCAAEAKAIEAVGADFVVAQGIEAGGHRGVFDPEQQDDQLTAHELVTAVSAVTTLPIVASGGLTSRSGIQQALDAGAVAVQLGTVFLTTHESGASPAHKRYLLEEQQRETKLTRGFSGRLARGIDNRFIEQMTGKSILPFPLQNTLTGILRARGYAGR